MNEKADTKRIISILVKNVRERRRVLGLSQEQLAERADLSINYVSKIEIGVKTPSLNTILRLAKALEMEPSDILVEKFPKWTDASHEMGYALRTLPDTEAEFLIGQFRASLKLIRKLLKDKPKERS